MTVTINVIIKPKQFSFLKDLLNTLKIEWTFKLPKIKNWQNIKKKKMKYIYFVLNVLQCILDLRKTRSLNYALGCKRFFKNNLYMWQMFLKMFILFRENITMYVNIKMLKKICVPKKVFCLLVCISAITSLI